MSQTKPQEDHIPELLIRDAAGDYRTATGEEALKAARQVLARRVRRGTAMTSRQTVRDPLTSKLASVEHEVFGAQPPWSGLIELAFLDQDW